MKERASLSLPLLSLAAALALTPLTAKAQESSPQDHAQMGGVTGEGTTGHGMMGGGMMGSDMPCSMSQMMGQDHGQMGGMKGGDMQSRMSQMMGMMHEKLTKAPERVAALKSELKITDAQAAAWDKFASALITAAKSAQASMDTMHDKMMKLGTNRDLAERLAGEVQMATDHLANLQAIKTALDPLYSSFNEEQKKLADGLKIGAMGIM